MFKKFIGRKIKQVGIFKIKIGKRQKEQHVLRQALKQGRMCPLQPLKKCWCEESRGT